MPISETLPRGVEEGMTRIREFKSRLRDARVEGDREVMVSLGTLEAAELEYHLETALDALRIVGLHVYIYGRPLG